MRASECGKMVFHFRLFDSIVVILSQIYNEPFFFLSLYWQRRDNTVNPQHAFFALYHLSSQNDIFTKQ